MSTEPTPVSQPFLPMDGTSEHVEEVNHDEAEESSKKEAKKLTSKVWQDFVKATGKDGEDIARCLKFKRNFVRDSSKGTSHLLKHQIRCVGGNKNIR